MVVSRKKPFIGIVISKSTLSWKWMFKDLSIREALKIIPNLTIFVESFPKDVQLNDLWTRFQSQELRWSTAAAGKNSGSCKMSPSSKTILYWSLILSLSSIILLLVLQIVLVMVIHNFSLVLQIFIVIIIINLIIITPSHTIALPGIWTRVEKLVDKILCP